MRVVWWKKGKDGGFWEGPSRLLASEGTTAAASLDATYLNGQPIGSRINIWALQSYFILACTKSAEMQMGRRAKYLTVDQAAAGHRQRTHRYEQGPHGKQVRSASRKAHNSVKGTRKDAKYSPPSPPTPPTCADVACAPLDPRIVEWRVFPLPDEEELFLDALHGARGRDFSPLDPWMVEPPFADDNDTTDPKSFSYITYTLNMGIALHGLRLRQERTEDIRHRAAFAAGGEEWKVAHWEELRELLARWTRVMVLPQYAVDSRKYAMWVHYTNWLARSISRLYYLEFLDLM
ncbi:hypothetical protein B0H19DRAFT_1072371 [Mycena capillaripes]|nr:hypothetical protein B0H19DRAFT_1072371 [Mycena capillaripes]